MGQGEALVVTVDDGQADERPTRTREENRARRDEQSRITAQVHREWSVKHTAVRFAPDEHPDGSDYNVEVLDVEATPEQDDDFDRMLNERLAAAGLLDDTDR